MNNERDMIIWKLDKDLARARLALARIYEVIDLVYYWNEGRAVGELRLEDVTEIGKTLQEFFDSDKGD